MTELEAARVLLAGLDMLAERLPIESETHSQYVAFRATLAEAVDIMESAAPPWEPEPAASVTLPWSQVACGDSVQAPNGQWYPVDSIARLGSGAMSVLLIGPTGGTVKSTPKAGDPVPVRRGPAGQAMDVLTAGGLELSLITSGVAA